MAGQAKHRGFGHVRKLPSGRHQASYVGPDNRRHTAVRTFESKQDAEGWLGREHTKIAEEKWIAPRRRAAIAVHPESFGEYAEVWLLDRDLQPRTREHYRSLLDRQILPTFKTTPLVDITPLTIRTWRSSLPNDRPTLRAHAYSLVRAILSTAVGDEVIASNPCVVRGAGASKRVRQIKPATLDELGKLIEAMPDKYRVAVMLSAWCGLRFGELTELRRRDIVLKGKTGVIHVRRAVTWVNSKPVIGKPKSDAGVRDVAIPPHLLPAIKAHLKEHAALGADGLVFPSKTGAHLTTSTLYASFWPARKKAGRPDLTWHGLRHTGAVLAASTGATLAELMARLGHSTPGAAMVYQHAAQGRDAEIAALLSKLSAT